MNPAFQRIVLLGILLRGVAAIFSIGFDHPHEIYRTLEPVAYLKGYGTVLPYEWTDQMLSWLPVHVHLFLLKIAGAFGIESSLSQALFLRVVYGVLSICPILATWKVTGSVLPCLFLAVWPEFVYRSVRLMDYSLEMSLLALAIGLALPRSKEDSAAPLGICLAGVCLACLFFVRFQSGLYFLGLLLALARPFSTAPSSLRNMIALTLSYSVTVLLLAGYEAGWKASDLFLPLVNYLRFNVVQNGAVQGWGMQPWHRYFSELVKFYGWLPFLGAFAFLFSQLRNFRLLKTIDLRLAVVFLIPLGVHLMIAHKEARFIFGFAWLLVPILYPVFQRLFSSSTSRSTIAVVLACLFVGGYAINLSRVLSRAKSGLDLTRQFAGVGNGLSNTSKNNPLPLLVELPAGSSPGAFYLRHKGPLYYQRIPQKTPHLYLFPDQASGHTKWVVQPRDFLGFHQNES